MSFLIAIVGRPNVGKSRLFNRLADDAEAIVHDYEGVTRDRQYADGVWYGAPFTVVDTGGFVPDAQEPMLAQMRDQAQLAMDDADVIVHMMDARAGLLASDREIVAMLRSADKPVFFAVNKVDSHQKVAEMLSDFWELGVDLWPTSAEHGLGVGDLLDAIAEFIPPEAPDEHSTTARIAVVGKPNAGKSSTINRLLGEDRLLTSEVAGTTRDAVDTRLMRGDSEYLLIDTAGLRRKKSISHRLEEFAVVQAIRSIDRADVVLFVIDATQGVTQQDKKIAGVIKNRGRACVVVVNKWDLVETDTHTAGEWVKALHWEMPFMEFAPVLFISALTGQRVGRILNKVDEVFAQYSKRIKTAEVNQFLERVVARHQPPLHRNRAVRFYYGTQVGAQPPTFMFSVNMPEGVKKAYRRYLINQLRQAYDFHGTPIRLVIRGRG